MKRMKKKNQWNIINIQKMGFSKIAGNAVAEYASLHPKYMFTNTLRS